MFIKKKSKKLKLTNFVKTIGLDVDSGLFITDGKLVKKEHFQESPTDLTIDMSGCIVSPGFIDPQVNGFNKCNFWDFPCPSFAEIDNLRLELAKCGVVAFCPTIITAQHEKIIKSIDYLSSYIKQASNDVGARILGIHIEGIFITKYGIHESKYAINDLTVRNIEPFVKENVVLFTLAPELDKTGEAISFLQKNNILASIGHSNATYKEGAKAIQEHGLRTVTHMFNALKGITGFSHRESESNSSSNIQILKSKLDNEKKIDPLNDGIMLALLKSKDVLCMVISDGIHVSKEVVGLLRQVKDAGHFALASDLISSDFYNLARLKNSLGGGQTSLDKCIMNLLNWNVSNLEDSLTCASRPIAKQLKVARQLGLGEISFGKEANLVLWDTKTNSVKGTIIGQNVFLNY